ncbi:MAG TPA: nuclear transport factor 2 family protein [Steroidobacteraceae bacterium]|nr:nuclear transport factor 2 family protein [Steroidobacteraceae bacterium]
MRRRACITASLLLLAAHTTLLPAAAPVADATTLRDIEQQQARAAIAGDRAALERFFAPTFMLVNPSGVRVTRAELLAVLTGGGAPPYTSATYETEEVTVRGDVAYTVGLETVVFGANVQGLQGAQPGQKVQRRVTHVWERQGGQWRLVLRHASNVAP